MNKTDKPDKSQKKSRCLKSVVKENIIALKAKIAELLLVWSS